jgi:hypothetical protein
MSRDNERVWSSYCIDVVAEAIITDPDHTNGDRPSHASP